MNSGAPARAGLEPEPGLRWWARITGLFLAVGMALFSPVLVSWFASDDFILYATLVQGGIPFFPDDASGGFLRPLVGLSLWIIYRIAGLEPFLPHAFSVLLHLANSLLVVHLALVIQHGRFNRNAFAPVAGGVLFLVLGCHGEAVAWISSLGDLLATFFVLLMLIQCSRALRNGATAHWIGSMTCMGLALLSKESAFAAPSLLLLLLLFHWGGGGRTPLRRDFIALLAHAALLIAYLLYRRWMLGAFVGGYGAHGHLRFYPDLVAQSVGRFLWRVFMPPMPAWVLAPIPNMEGLWAWGFIAAIIAAVLVVAWRTRGHMGPGLFCALAFFAALTPVFNVRIYLSEMEGERYLYLPSVFVALGAGYAIANLSAAKWRLSALVVAAILQAGVLVTGILHWEGSSALARIIVTGIQDQHQGGTIILINKPDAYQGALVLRTGLAEALQYFGPHPVESPDLTTLFSASVYQWDHRFAVSATSDAQSTIIALSGDDPNSSVAEEDRRDLIEVLKNAPQYVEFQFRAALHGAEIFYYDSSGVHAVAASDVSAPPHPLNPR